MPFSWSEFSPHEEKAFVSSPRALLLLQIHEEFGGVVPGLARDAHERNLDAVIGTALRQAGLQPGEVVGFARARFLLFPPPPPAAAAPAPRCQLLRRRRSLTYDGAAAARRWTPSRSP